MHIPACTLSAWQMVIKDLQTGARIETVPGQCSGEAEWGDDEHLYYLRRDENHREYQVWRHQLGADTGDVLLLEETDGLFTVDIYKSQRCPLTSSVLYIPTGACRRGLRQAVWGEAGRRQQALTHRSPDAHQAAFLHTHQSVNLL